MDEPNPYLEIIAALEATIVSLRDYAAELWMKTQHSAEWYIGNASTAEWNDAYLAVDEMTEAKKVNP